MYLRLDLSKISRLMGISAVAMAAVLEVRGEDYGCGESGQNGGFAFVYSFHGRGNKKSKNCDFRGRYYVHSVRY
jgi:hypothetical protein